MDRLLLDILIGTELYAFADEIYKKGRMTNSGFVPPPLRELKIGWLWFRVWLFNGLIYGLSIGALLIADYLGWVGRAWSLGLAGLLLLIFVFYTVRSIFALPRAAEMFRDAQEPLRSIMNRIESVYSNLGTDGPISVRRLRSEIEEATHYEIRWPPAIFALLDDVEKRVDRL